MDPDSDSDPDPKHWSKHVGTELTAREKFLERFWPTVALKYYTKLLKYSVQVSAVGQLGIKFLSGGNWNLYGIFL
jgi:hypothetical protein